MHAKRFVRFVVFFFFDMGRAGDVRGKLVVWKAGCVDRVLWCSSGWKTGSWPLMWVLGLAVGGLEMVVTSVWELGMPVGLAVEVVRYPPCACLFLEGCRMQIDGGN